MVGYSFNNYLIEVGNQVCIMSDGTTGKKDSELQLRKFTQREISNLTAKSLQILNSLERKISSTESDDEIVKLLTIQIGELVKLTTISISMGLYGITEGQ